MVCRGELQGLGAELEKRGIREAVVDAVSAHEPSELTSYQAKVGPAIRLVADPKREAIRAYGLFHAHGGPHHEDISRPSTFVLDRDGKVVFAHVARDVLDRPDPVETVDAYARAASAR
ncbi:MAG TPA: redoxin domain-containing protein [Planctomycetota bacterium]|nr:redoxin domain-containing protein [Planctomycetota bacterium]